MRQDATARNIAKTASPPALPRPAVARHGASSAGPRRWRHL